MDAKDWVTAGAAVLAAVLSLITLIVTGRRLQVSWTRDVLASAFVDFLSASYRTRGALKHMARVEAGQGRAADETRMSGGSSFETVTT